MFFQIIGGTSVASLAPFTNGMALAVWSEFLLVVFSLLAAAAAARNACALCGICTACALPPLAHNHAPHNPNNQQQKQLKKVYTAANISGGHLNPAVTFSVFSCGFYPALHSILYIILQCVGAMFGSLVTVGLVPGTSIGMGDGGPGCFDRAGAVHKSLSNSQIFGWEVVMTFTLISCVYACGVAKPGHGSHPPFAVGHALLCCAASGGQYTGAALNPARVIGPLAVFRCGVDVWWLYVLGQFTAAILACSVFAFVSGLGPLNPYQSYKEFGLKWHESVEMWVTGSPPARLRSTPDGDENVTEMMKDMKEQRQADKKAASGAEGKSAL